MRFPLLAVISELIRVLVPVCFLLLCSCSTTATAPGSSAGPLALTVHLAPREGGHLDGECIIENHGSESAFVGTAPEVTWTFYNGTSSKPGRVGVWEIEPFRYEQLPAIPASRRFRNVRRVGEQLCFSVPLFSAAEYKSLPAGRFEFQLTLPILVSDRNRVSSVPLTLRARASFPAIQNNGERREGETQNIHPTSSETGSSETELRNRDGFK
jgi:hypothetical protein